MPSYTRRISLIGGLIFLAMALAGTIGGFQILFPQAKNQLYHSLQHSLVRRDDRFAETLNNAWLDGFTFSAQDELNTVVSSFDRQGGGGKKDDLIRVILRNVPNFGFSSVVVYNRSGEVLSSYGALVNNPDIDIVVKTPSPGHLLWKKGFFFRTSFVLKQRGRQIGSITTETPLPQLNDIDDQVYLGNTTDYAICAKVSSSTMSCFPFRSAGWKVLDNIPVQQDGKPLPMAYALAGKSGLINTRDYRGIEVIAAYQPVLKTGLGSVLKIDAAELYEPLYAKYRLLGLFMLGLIAAGMLLLYKLVLPLVNRMSAEIGERMQAENRVLEQNNRLEGLINGAMDAIITIDENQVITLFNHAAEATFGYRAEEVVGKSVEMLIPERYRPQHENHVSQFGRSGRSARGVDETRNLYGLRSNGEEFPIEASLSKVVVFGKPLYTAILRDISDRVQSRKKIALLNQIYHAMSEASRSSHLCKSENELFADVCRIAVDLGGMKMAWVGKLTESGSRVEPVARYGTGTDYLDKFSIRLDSQESSSRGPSAVALRTKQPVIIQDFRCDPVTAGLRELAQPYGWGASATLPILKNDKVYGVLNLYHSESNPFNDDMIALLVEMAEDVSRGLDRLDLEMENRTAEASMRLAAAIYESSAEGVMVTDENNLIIDVNPAFTKITGYTLEDVKGKSPSIFKSGIYDAEFYQEMWRAIIEDGHWQGELWDLRKDGEVHAKWITISAIHNPDGSIYRYVAEFSDITEKKRQEELIWKQANYDALTSLPNRRLLGDRISHAMAVTQRNGQHAALIALDLDHFKQLNDTMGHTIGDKLLVEVARRLESTVREEDTVARMGGDEFLIVLTELNASPSEAAAEVEQVAEKIRTRLSTTYLLEKTEYYVTPSIGVVIFRGHELLQDHLLSRVDTAMYQAKAKGRNAICFFDEQMQAAVETRSKLERALRVAPTRGQLQLYYQVQVNSHGEYLGAEALLRWQHPDLGLVSPAQFIPLAEETALILPLGNWVLDRACGQLARWQHDLRLRDLSISVNVSPRQFRENTFVDDVRSFIERYEVNPRLLKLELTESLVLEHVEEVIFKMEQLKSIGLKFSMDDFGTGYSSLSNLSRLPFDQLKIDQSFIRNVVDDENDAEIVQAIISLGLSLGLEVMAEGVETKEQRKFLERLGCLAYQGYLFSKPCPIDEAERVLLA